MPEKEMSYWAKLFLQLGFPSTVALLLLGALLGWLPTPLMKSIENLQYQSWQNGIVLRAMCYNLAQTESAKYRCEPWKNLERE